MSRAFSSAPPVLPLPAALALQGFATRAARPDDRAFERRLFETARTDAAMLAAWPAAARTPFLDQQFQFQTAHYARVHPRAERWIVTAQRAPVGRLILDRTAGTWHVVDIALLPSWRRRGLGGALLQAVLAAGTQAGAAVALDVETGNPARRLYERIGFTVVATEPPYHAMLWTAPSSGPALRSAPSPSFLP